MTTKYSSIGIFCKPNLPDSTLLYTVDTILSTIYGIGSNCSVYIEASMYTLQLLPIPYIVDNIVSTV